eukprot:Skav236550  [mRNA]  locus=scaffold1066:27066:29097:- [translate_table: standard]
MAGVMNSNEDSRFKSLAEQVQQSQSLEDREMKTPPSNTLKYNLVGMQPGTYYYCRVASVNEMGLSDWSPVSLPSPSVPWRHNAIGEAPGGSRCAAQGAYPPSEIPQARCRVQHRHG